MARAARRSVIDAVTTGYRAVVAYDGTDYAGFQRQAGDTPTIQGALEEAIQRVAGQRVTVKGAGRTDAGVHATGQVIGFEVPWRHSPDDLQRALNANLPEAIALQALTLAEPGFHPRYDARRRAYEYTLYRAPVRQPLLNKYAWHVLLNRPLELEAMQRAAALLVGTHDFATFGQPPQGETTIREVFHSGFSDAPGDLLRYTIEAIAFLYRMVRRIVGALVRVGSGELTPDQFEVAFCAADGSWPNPTAPAQGLCLVKVTY
jgi:tRNA pseudouridine38-40 synthase